MGLDRSGYLRVAACGAGAAAVIATGQAIADETPSPSPETMPRLTPRPAFQPVFPDGMTTADIIVETLIAWGATHAFGIAGEETTGINEAIRKRRDRIRYVAVRNEEAAAFMASGFARHTGRLSVCIGTTGPGAIRLMNGLYDTCLDGTPVVALTGMTSRDVIDTRYRQGADATRLMRDFALYHVEVTGPGHALSVADHACHAALDDRRVAHLMISRDVQRMVLPGGEWSMGNVRDAASLTATAARPPDDRLQAAVAVLNRGRRVATLCGRGALHAREEVSRIADTLGATVATTLSGKAVLPDDSPFTTGGIGEAGTAPSAWAMKACDTLLILGSAMPETAYYPDPGQARVVQVDIRPDRLGLRHPVEVGLAGDVRATLREL